MKTYMLWPLIATSRSYGSNDGSQNMFLCRNLTNYPIIIPVTPSYLDHCFKSWASFKREPNIKMAELVPWKCTVSPQILVWANCACFDQTTSRAYLFFWLSDRVFPSLEWQQITKSALWNFAIIWVLPFLNNPKDLDLSYKMNLSFWNCFGRKKTRLITEEIR